MKIKFAALAAIILSSAAGFSQTCIKNVTLIDVVTHKLVKHQTVIFIAGRINAVGGEKTPIPKKAKVVDGTGKFLMPGLVDAHMHFFQSGGLYTRPDIIDLQKYKSYENEIAWQHQHIDDLARRYIKAGITSVISTGTSFNFFKDRDSLAKHHYSPGMYMAGPLITTNYEPAVFRERGDDEPFNRAVTPEQGREFVRQQLPYHPDLIKIWFIVLGDNPGDTAKKYQLLVAAIIDEAHKHRLPVAVHATERVTAEIAVSAGCDYLAHEIDDEVVSADFIELLKKNKVVVCPTLNVIDGFRNTFSRQTNFTYYELTNANPEQLGSLYDLKYLSDTVLSNKYKQIFTNPRFAKTDSIRMVNLKKMADGGVTIAAGTDAGGIGTLHATSFFAELKAMKQSGLSNWQILESATINGAKAIGKDKEFGSIEKGKEADMILLKGNPVFNVKNLKNPILVISNGYCINPDTLVKDTPSELVQRSTNGFNAGNMKAFIEPYSGKVKFYSSPANFLGSGQSYLRILYGRLLMEVNDKRLHKEVGEQHIEANTVIQRERLINNSRQVYEECIARYVICHGKISRVYFAGK